MPPVGQTSATAIEDSDSFAAQRQQLRKKRQQVNSATSETVPVVKSELFREISGAPALPKVDALQRSAQQQTAQKLQQLAQQQKVDEDNKRTWFQKGSDNVGKAIFGSGADVVENLGAAVLGLGEKALDAIASLAPYAAQGLAQGMSGSTPLSIGQQQVQNQMLQSNKDLMSGFVAKDLYDEGKIAKSIISDPFKALTGIDAEKDSVFGEKTDALIQSAGQLAAQAGLQLVGVPWWLTAGASALGSEAEAAIQSGATLEEAALSGMISAGAEILTEKISGGIKFGGKTLDDAIAKKLASGISNKAVRSLAKLGIDMAGEGGEEVLSGAISKFGQWLTYLDDQTLGQLLFSEEALDEALESFIGGAVLGGVGSLVQSARPEAKSKDYVTRENETQSSTVRGEMAPGVSTIQGDNSADSKGSPAEPSIPGLRLRAVDTDTQNNTGVTEMQAIDTQKGESVPQKQGFVTQDRAVGTENISVAEQLRRQNMNGGTENVSINGQSAGLAAAGNAETAGTGAGLLHGSSQRLDGTGTAEQTGIVAGGAEQAAQRQQSINQQRAAVDRRNRIRSLRLAKISSSELGIQSGTEARNIQLVPQEHWDAEMRTVAERVYQETGKSVSYVMGAVQVRGNDGRVRNVNGVISGDNIVVRADHLRLSLEQIADHEAYHGRVDFFGDRLNQEIRQHIIETYSEEEFRSMLTKYVEALRGVYNAEDMQTGEDFAKMMKQVQEEVFADAYAGINAFGAGADRFTTAVNEKMEQLGTGRFRSQEQENGVKETNGPPADVTGQKENTAGNGGERYSIDERFESLIDSWDGNTIGFSFVVGETSDALQEAGIPKKQIRWDASKIKTLLGKHNGMTIETVKQIPELLENPIIVIDSKKGSNSKIVMGDLYDEHGNVVTAVILLTPTSKKGNVLDILKISSAEGRGHIKSLFTHEDGTPVAVRFVDKKRIQSWLNVNRLQLPLHNLDLDSNDIIDDPTPTVKEESSESDYLTDEQFRDRYGLKLRAVDELENGANSQAFEKMQNQDEKKERFSVDDPDQRYMDAVNSGDMETAQQMVDEAAAAAGYTIKAYHGTTNQEEHRTWNDSRHEWDTTYTPITVFKRQYPEQAGHFFNSDIDNAGGYGSYVYSVYLMLRKPLVINCQGQNYASITHEGKEMDTYEWADYAKKQRYDGVIFENISDGVGYNDLNQLTTDYVVFDSNRIKSADTVTYDNDRNIIPLSRRFSVTNRDIRYSVDDDSGELDFAGVRATMNAQSKEWNEMYLRNQLGDDGYEKYRKWEKEQQDQKKQESKERAKQRTAEKQAARKSATKPVAESKPIEAKKELRGHMLSLFSIPEGSKAELGSVIDSYADRLLKNGALTEEDRKHFFDRMYDAGVMTVPAEDYFSDARDILKGGRVYVPESVRADFGDDWNDIRRRAFGARIYFTTDPSAGGIDTWNQELAEELPGLFDAEETDMRSILERIVEIAEEGRDDQMSLAEYTALLAGQERVSEKELLDGMERQMDEALRTFAKQARLEVKLRDRTGTRIAKERAEHMEMAQRQRDRKELRQMQEKTLKALQWLNKNRNRAPEELKETWDEVLGDIDLYAIGAANEMRWSDKYNATWKDLAQMYKDAMKNDPNFLPSKELEMIISRLDGAKIADMDLGALNDLYKAAIGLRTEFYNRNNVISDEMQRLFAEVYTDAKHEIEAAPGKYTGKKLDKLMNLDQLTPMNVLQRMGGWDPNGAFYSMARQLEKGERDMRAYSVKAKRMLQDFLTEHADWVKKADGQGKDGIWYEIEVPELMELGMGNKPIFGDTVKVFMTPAQKVHMYLENKNADNLRHMTGGRTFADKTLYSEGKRQEALAQGRTIRMAPETVKAIVSDLTAEEMELARLLEQYYNSFATQEINRISNVLYGYDKAMGKNYAPIYTNRNYTKAEFGVFDQTAEGVGNLKGRQYAVNPSYNISAFDAFERHVDQTSRFVGMAIPARNWTTLMNWREKNNSTGDVITHKWGEEGKKYITDLISSLQAGEDAKSETVSNWASKLQSTYITAIFGANPSIVLKQLGSIPLASAYLDARNVPSAVQVKNIDRNLIAKYTQDLEWRTMGYSMPETKHLKENPNWTQTNKFYGFVFGGDAITAMDGWAASVLWPWAENKVRREHPNLEVGTKEQIDKGESPFYKKVAELFEDALARSQSTSDEIHQGSLRKSKNPITRAFTLFRSDSAQTYNTLRQKIGEAQYYARTGADEKVKATAKKAVGAAFVSMALNAMWAESINFLMALWKNKGKRYRDEEEELTLQSVLGEMVSGMLGSFAGVVTFGEEIFEVIGNLLTGEKIYDIETPGMEQINDLITSISTAGGSMREIVSGAADVVENGGDVWKYFKDNSPDILGSIKDLAEKVVMYLPGLPASGIPVSNIEGYLLGAVKWMSPELGTAYDDLFASVDKGDLSGLKGDALKSRLGRILRDRGATDSDETVQELAALYEAGHKSAVPGATPDSVTVDGEKRELGTYQQQVYEKAWTGIVADVLDEIVVSEGYADADTEGRSKILSRLYSYASEKAKAEVFDDYEINTAAEKIDAAKEGGELTADCFMTEDYKELIGAGLKSEDAYELIDRIEEAVDSAGDDGIESVDKWRICVDMFRDSSDQLAALSMVMTSAQLEKAEMANENGVDPEAYVSFYEIRKNYDADGNGRYTQAEVKAAIDSMGNRCTAEQKAVLWQLATGSTSAKNNPYSSAVGQKIIDAKKAAKDAEAELPRLILGGG